MWGATSLNYDCVSILTRNNPFTFFSLRSALFSDFFCRLEVCVGRPASIGFSVAAGLSVTFDLTAFPFGLDFRKNILYLFSTFFRLLVRLFCRFLPRLKKLCFWYRGPRKWKLVKFFELGRLIWFPPPHTNQNSPTNPNPVYTYRIHVPVRNREAVISRSWEVNLSRVCSLRYVAWHIAGKYRRYYWYRTLR